MKRGLGLFLLLLLVAPVGAAQAKVLYNRDGIQLHGSAKVVAYNAATCRVVEEKYPEDVYEKMKGNDGHPLDIWQMDYSVHNGTGKLLSYLRAQFFIVSEWPPCTNWEDDRNLPAIQYKWSGRNPVIAMTYGMRLDQMVQETMYLLVFRGQEPFFKEWDVHFTFEPGAKQPGKSIPEPSPPIQRQEPGSKAGIENHCSGKPKGSACWMELSNQPECYVWNGGLEPDVTVTWTGECTGERAQGTGTLKWVWDGGREDFSESYRIASQDGKMHGDWVLRYASGTEVYRKAPMWRARCTATGFFAAWRTGTSRGRPLCGRQEAGPLGSCAWRTGAYRKAPMWTARSRADWVYALCERERRWKAPMWTARSRAPGSCALRADRVWEGPYVEGKRHGRLG